MTGKLKYDDVLLTSRTPIVFMSKSGWPADGRSARVILIVLFRLLLHDLALLAAVVWYVCDTEQINLMIKSFSIFVALLLAMLEYLKIAWATFV